MLLREVEARGKYCGPFRVARTIEDYDGTSDYCNGMHCMMWRWHATHRVATTSPNSPSPAIRATEPIPINERLGYCGLAGRINYVAD